MNCLNRSLGVTCIFGLVLARTEAQTSIFQIPSGSAVGVSGVGPDSYYSGGLTDRQSNAVDTTGVDTFFYPEVYLNERYSGPFSYTLPGLTVGQSYSLKLHFAETIYTAAGQRQFNVAINGTTYLSNFDIIAEAGGPNKAIIKTYTVTPNAAGQIVISFTNGAAQTAKVSAIELYNIGAVSSGVASTNATVVYQISCGGTASGSFSADNYYSGGTSNSYAGAVTTSAVNNPAPAAAYQRERSGTGSAITYTLPGLSAGKAYTVRLHFAENVFANPGQRMFHVSINGQRVLSNFDIRAAAGATNKAIVQAFPASANSSGQIVVVFSPGAASVPKISAIELVTGIRINSGGAGASYWEADQGFNLGQVSLSTSTVDTTQAANPAPAAVYQSNRYGWTNYILRNLTPGYTYMVRLHFAEVVYTKVGKRGFNVVINGTQVLTNYDIFANAGAANRANVQQFSTTANSAGQIVVNFNVGAVDGPLKQGIEVVGGSPNTAGAGQYKVSGYVTVGGSGPSAGTGIAGVTLTVSGGQIGYMTTASDGSYSFIVNSGGNYTITPSWPSAPRYTLSGPISVSNVTTNQTNINFSAALFAGGSLSPTLPSKEYIYLNNSVVAVEHQH